MHRGMMDRMSTVYASERRLSLRAPADLARIGRALRRGRKDPTIRVEGVPGRTRISLTARPTEVTGSGVAAVMEQVADTGLTASAPIHVLAWGNDPETVETFLASADALIGLDDDWSDFVASPAFRQIPHHVRSAYRLHPGLRLSATGWVFKHTVSAVFEQRVTGSEAIGAWQNLVRHIGPPAPASPRGAPALPADMRIFPTPEQWLSVPTGQWHRAGVDMHRATTVRGVAALAPSLIRLSAADDVGAVARALASVPGIGPWTVAEAMQRSHGLPDAISLGDYHLAHNVCYALVGRRGDDSRMLELLKPWAGNRQRVVRMIGMSQVKEFRRGPRVAPRSLAG